MNATAIKDGDRIDAGEFECAHETTGCKCPKHGTEFRKMYTYGSSMSGETDVYTFRGCGCAVAMRHDPLGFDRSTASYHATFGAAEGVGRFHAALCKAKYA